MSIIQVNLILPAITVCILLEKETMNVMHARDES